MAPPRPSNPVEYNEFMKKLAAYHEKRGTLLDPTPKVAGKSIDLLQLFNYVVAEGGYDKISGIKLAWRKVAADWGFPANNIAPPAFSLKSVFYKNLAAYEISTIHGKEPPPKEILEDVTAKGTGLMSRTLENYRPAGRESGALGNENSDISGDDGTPARERNESEEVLGSGGRVTRGLRQAPPQRILFQPETGSSRVTRNVSATSHAPSPQHNSHQYHQQQQPRGASTTNNPSSNMENMSLAVANYEPRPHHPLTLRPIVTPGNNPAEFARRQKFLNDAAAGKPLPSKQSGIMLPGKYFDGPNIYVRCLQALRSGIFSEQNYALHHLVKISMERGDKYRFEGFPGLAEALVEKVMEVASLFFKVNWQVAYTEEEMMSGPYMLNGIDGTPDILLRMAKHAKLYVDDNIYTAEFADKMLQINEAALTLRNMVMLEDNALYVSDLAPLRDLLSIVLNLPVVDSVVELKHYALDIAEQITKYLHFDETDPLYISLLAQLQSDDRGAILTSLRAISRISMQLEENNLLKGVPATAIQNIIDWTLLNDEDLAHACLDFLYQYTAVVDNVDFLLANVQVEPLVNQLVRLLAYGARHAEREYALTRDGRVPAPQRIAPLPRDLLPQLIKLDEPERSSQWLRCLFEEDPEESITQIALWQAYQACFTPTVSETGHALLPAADFIKNVSTTFGDKAAAQVQPGVVQKFIIKGIRMRSAPVGLNGEEALGCKWKIKENSPELCREYFMSPEEVHKHILKAHLGGVEKENGQWENKFGRQYTCLWTGCTRFKTAPATTLLQMANHIKVHLPPKPVGRKGVDDGPPPMKKLKPSYIVSAPRQAFSYQVTATDDRQDAAGIPLSAVLVLRNLARNLSKTEAEEAALKSEGGVSWVDRLFKPVEQRLFEVMTHNKSLTLYMTDLLSAIKDA
ncbi:uncharacterized protein LY89DRAFT_785796 [Mollisia scopiformis]|uniref:Uncharacterized protein n=1 Tax=Mollisia scopiformis TaxID=149040 RepID=A0A194WWS7_MOLSC|nr:uncharacterized protein LY89DRAFT_785796 [Mollisia scopiformis]KUJ12431.1 hypothetical protein LY89DRAFT_785796 [Mollisia scopiformis]